MLRILHLEDSKEDALLIEEMVRNEGIQAEFVRVTNGPEFSRALEQFPFDLILADSGLPGFDGLAALKMARTKCPDIPFICVSGNPAPASIKAHFDRGVTDFISKNDLPRLMEALRREQDWLN